MFILNLSILLVRQVLFLTWYGLVIVWILSMYYRSYRSRSMLFQTLRNKVLIFIFKIIKIFKFKRVLLQGLNKEKNQKKCFQRKEDFKEELYLNDLISDYILIFEKVLINISNIMYMYKFGTISKRYWTKKKLMLKYGKKKHYNVHGENYNNNDISLNHSKHLLIPLEASNKNDLFIKESFLHLQQNDEIVIKEKYNMVKQIHNNLEDLKEKDKIMKNVEKLELKGIKEVIKLYNNYNFINKIKTHKILGILEMNYTTDIKKNSVLLVEVNKLKQKPLNKGIGLHTKNSLLLKIKSDKDFIQVFTYILENIDDDLNQKILIEKNTEIKDLNELYNFQAEKILKQIGLKEIIINNKIQTKKELLQYLIENWTKIREE